MGNAKKNIILITLCIFLSLFSLRMAQAQGKILSEQSAFIKGNTIEFPKTRQIEYPEYGVTLGSGWDSNTDNKKQASCIEFTEDFSGGQSATVSVSRVNETDTFRKEINVSYGATAKAKFKVASGSMSAKMSFYNKSKIENHSLNLLVKGNVKNGVSFVSFPKAQQDVSQVDEEDDTQIVFDEYGTIKLNRFGQRMFDSGIENFYKHCGDSFVSAIERGAELYALYSFSESDSTITQSKTTKFSGSASYLGFSGSLNYDSNKLIEQTKNRAIGSVQYYHSAHRGLSLPFDETSIYNSLNFLGSSLKLDDSYPFKIHVTRYDALPSFEEQMNVGASLNEVREAYRVRLVGLVSRLDHIIKYPEFYSLEMRGKDVHYYRELQDSIQLEISRIEKESMECLVENIMDDAERLGQCLAKDDGKYVDYFYRAQMPVHNEYKRDKTKEEIQIIDELNNLINSLTKRYNSITVNVYKKAKKCKWGIGRGGICGYDYINEGCKVHPGHSTCVSLDNQIRSAKYKKIDFENRIKPIIDADSRFIYWIDDTSRERRKTGEINGYLSNAQLDLIKNEIYCQYENINKITQVPEGELFEPLKCPKINERILSGDNLKFTYTFNEKYKKDRDLSLSKILNNHYLAKKKEVDSIINSFLENELQKANANYSNDAILTIKSMFNNSFMSDNKDLGSIGGDIQYGSVLEELIAAANQLPEVVSAKEDLTSLSKANDYHNNQIKVFDQVMTGAIPLVDSKSFVPDSYNIDLPPKLLVKTINSKLLEIYKDQKDFPGEWGWVEVEQGVSLERDFDVNVESY